MLVPVASIIPSLKSLLLATVFSSFLIPTAVVLFFFSTPILRRRPTFVLNVCAIVLGLVQGMLYMYFVVSRYSSMSSFLCTKSLGLQIKELIAMPPSPTVISVMTALCIVIPICVQTILFLRVLAVYPPQQLSLPVRIGIYGPLIAMKAARVANAFSLIDTVQRNTGDALKTIASQSAAIWSSPFAKSELFLQFVYGVCVQQDRIKAPLRSHSYQIRFRALLTEDSYGSQKRTPSDAPGRFVSNTI